MSQPLVEIKHLVKSYTRGDQIVPVLHDITLDIARGDFISLMGPSGSEIGRASCRERVCYAV